MTAIIFILVLSLLVFVHELGHFVAARKSGMRVDEFGFGFPPRLFGVRRENGKFKLVWGHREPDQGSTVYSVNWIPLGGFVRIAGENADLPNDPQSFQNRPAGRRIIVLAAGVTMNVLLAYVITTAGLMFGLPAVFGSSSEVPKGAHLTNAHVGIVEMVPGRPAEKAGVKLGDTVVSVDGKTFSDSPELHEYVTANAGKNFEFVIRRGQETKTLSIQSEIPTEGRGPTGVVLATLGTLRYPWYQAPVEGAKATGYQIRSVVSGLYQLASGKVGLKNVGGPVQIARLTGEASRLGFPYLMQLTAFLSLNLAVLNILPIPALDGGRIVFVLYEIIRRKKASPMLEQVVNSVGFVLLLLLMAVITFKDIFIK